MGCASSTSKPGSTFKHSDDHAQLCELLATLFRCECTLGAEGEYMLSAHRALTFGSQVPDAFQKSLHNLSQAIASHRPCAVCEVTNKWPIKWRNVDFITSSSTLLSAWHLLDQEQLPAPGTPSNCRLVSDNGKNIVYVCMSKMPGNHICVDVIEEVSSNTRFVLSPENALDVKCPLPNVICREKIGMGGFATVYRGTLLVDGHSTDVAVKHISSSDIVLTPLEAVITQDLTHMNVVKAHKYHHDRDTWIAMEFCNGGNLTDRLGQLSARQQDACIAQIVAGMRFLHSKHILHGDLTSMNVLFNDGTAKIADFGLSRLYMAGTMMTDCNSHGSIIYTSPELIFDGKLSQALDVYAFGIIVYEIVSGRPAEEWYREASTGNDTKSTQISAQSLSTLKAAGKEPRLDADNKWSDLCARCVQLDYQQRPSFDEIHEHFLVDSIA